MTVVRLEGADDDRVFGGKAAELGAALRADLPVPDGLAVSHDRLDELVVDGTRRSRLVNRVRELDGPYVVRSSGIGEDSQETSFAGQHLTVINITDATGVIDALERVHASARSTAVMEYRDQMGIDEPPRIGAVVQTLVDADKSGVLFTRNPVDASDERLVEATWGLGEAVVESMVTPDRFRLAPSGEVLERQMGRKEVRVVPASGGGTRTVRVPDAKQDRLCLNDTELEALNRLARRCSVYRNGAHDIEWAFADETLYLLQRRAITTGG